VILTPAMAAMALQILPQLGKVTGMLIGGKKGEDIVTKSAMLSQFLGAASTLGSAFASPSTGEGLGISTYEDFKGALTKDYGAFKGLPKDMTRSIKLPEGIGGFGEGALKISEGWDAPKGIFDPPGKEEIGWIRGLDL